jgi:hypothetical protein
MADVLEDVGWMRQGGDFAKFCPVVQMVLRSSWFWLRYSMARGPSDSAEVMADDALSYS